MIQGISQQAAPQTMILLPQTEWEGLKQEIKELAKVVMSKKKEEALDEWVESGVARKMLGVSQKTWQTYRDNRVIPFSQFGRKIYVKKADLEAFMQSHYITAKE
jgi:ABC-type hemin transport system substrate-binding protein